MCQKRSCKNCKEKELISLVRNGVRHRLNLQINNPIYDKIDMSIAEKITGKLYYEFQDAFRDQVRESLMIKDFICF